MASEYFESLHYIWLNIVFFIFSLFLFAVCLYACLFVRWVYKRRLRQKTDAMIECYRTGEDKRKELELDMQKQELKSPVEIKKVVPKQTRKIHIVSKPCAEVAPKKLNELVARQVKERTNDEVMCSPTYAPPQQQLTRQQVQQLQTQYVMVPMEVLRNQLNSNRQAFPPMMPFVLPKQDQKTIVESVSTQTSETKLEKKTSEDWLAGYDERDAEKEENRVNSSAPEEEEESDSDKIMKKRLEQYNREKKRSMTKPPVLSDETRVSIESDTPPSSAQPTSSGSTSAPTKTTTSTDSHSADGKHSGPTGKDSSSGNTNGSEDKESKKEPSRSSYFTSPGDNALSAKSQPPPKTDSSRPSIFPYFVDSKAPGAEATTGKSVSKLTDLGSDGEESSYDLYRGTVKSKIHKSQKIYTKPSKSNNY